LVESELQINDRLTGFSINVSSTLFDLQERFEKSTGRGTKDPNHAFLPLWKLIPLAGCYHGTLSFLVRNQVGSRDKMSVIITSNYIYLISR
jgi:hypothetical protein